MKTGECGLIDYLRHEFRNVPQETPKENGFGLYVRADDDSGLQVELKTGADFGCTLFAAMPPNPIDVAYNEIVNDPAG